MFIVGMGGEMGTLLYFWWEYKSQHPFSKAFLLAYLKHLKYKHTLGLLNIFLGFYPTEITRLHSVDSPIFLTYGILKTLVNILRLKK